MTLDSSLFKVGQILLANMALQAMRASRMVKARLAERRSVADLKRSNLPTKIRITSRVLDRIISQSLSPRLISLR
jgi:hypothetical protein